MAAPINGTITTTDVGQPGRSTNTGYSSDAKAGATQALREAGEEIDDRLLQYLSPPGWEHINLTGDYVWRQSRKVGDGRLQPLFSNGKA